MALSYYRNVRTTAKGRWYGRKLSEIALEFGYGAKLIGDPEHIVQGSDIVEYTVHVHEPPVPSLDLQSSILYEDDHFIVVNKPSGIPVHPTVNYYHNSVTEVLKPIFGSLYPCYRLDRLTSGILILGKSQEFVSQFNRSHREKTYYTRVNASQLPESLLKTKKLTATEPIVTFNGKRGFSQFLVSLANAKAAETHIELIGIQKDVGLATLKVEPITGRTHQIRKHLALHGMPIHNDEVYADDGRFKALCETPSEETFGAVWQFAERSRMAKLTGETCEECGAPIYNRQIKPLDLHCANYVFDQTSFEAPPPFPIAR